MELELREVELPLDYDPQAATAAAALLLGIPPHQIASTTLLRRAIDARRARPVRFKLNLLIALADPSQADLLIASATDRGLSTRVLPASERQPPAFLKPAAPLPQYATLPPRPIVVGTGPCGLFCSLVLARHGLRPIVFERGKPVGPRARDVTGFWRRDWPFDPSSNIQFGEGGAGTFSDGKLYTQVRDRDHRIPWLLEEMVAKGAPHSILTDARPHVGTDRLAKVVRGIREEILALGGEIHFESHVTALHSESGRARAVELASGETFEGSPIILAVGHSARDVFAMLHELNLPLEPKPFSIGLRIEHPQEWIDRIQFGKDAGHPQLGAAPYKFAQPTKGGRSAYSFCMCPGGLVVAAASEPGSVVTNGMSSYARAEANANCGFMVEISPEEFADPSGSPLAGIEYQRRWEQAAFVAGGSDYRAPVQRLADFLSKSPSTSQGTVAPSYLPGVNWTSLDAVLPEQVASTLRAAIPLINRKLHGFALDDAVLTGVETRSSSPIRIPRDPITLQSTALRDLYPAGEGAGYAGGIISAALDGLRVAGQILAARNLSS
jgi:uncharacterized protein